jgi:hypothetical protein
MNILNKEREINMKKVGFAVLIIVLLGTLISGKIHYDNKVKAQGKQARIAFEKDLKIEEKKREDLLNSLNPDNGDVSYYDFLKYRLLKNGTAKVSLIGSSVTFGTGGSCSARPTRPGSPTRCARS